MEQFTFKDLIKLNQTCFVCRGTFTQTTIVLDSPDSENVPLTCNLRGDLLFANIKTSYQEGSYQLVINIVTHQFSFVPEHARHYVNMKGDLCLLLKCNGCNSQTYTNNFEFDDSGIILPLSLDYQILFLRDYDHLYTVTTAFNPEVAHSKIAIDTLSKAVPLSPMEIKVPAFSIFDFKNVHDLIKKIKLYMVLS